MLAIPSLAQEKPEAPTPKTDRKVFFAGVSLLAASKTADAITTRQLLDRVLGFFAAQSTVFYFTVFYFTERSRHKWIRWTGRAFLAHTIEEHSRFAVCNSGIDPRSPAIRN